MKTSIAGKVSLSRRQCIVAATTVLAVSLNRTLAAAQDAANVFVFSRSGRFTPLLLYPVVLGGFVVPKPSEPEIEAALEQSAHDIGFGVPLIYGTNRRSPVYLRQALAALSQYPVSFVGATIDTEGWQAEVDGVPAMRQETEAAFLSEALSLPGVELMSVRHARQQDDEIYAALEQQLGMAPTRFYDSHDDSSRLYQVASTVVKCFGSLYGRRPVTGARREMIDDVLQFFGVDEQPASWHTDRLQIDNVVFDP